MEFNMTVAFTNCTDEIRNSTTGEYQKAVELFTFIIWSLGTVLSIPVVGIDQLKFHCGSIIGSGRMRLPNHVADDSIQVANKFNDVIRNNLVPEISKYGISSMTVSDVDECETGDHNCDENADCFNLDPGFNCSCHNGHRDREASNPGTRCEAFCDFDGGSYCLHNGSCLIIGDSGPACNCTPQFSGERCEYEVHATNSVETPNVTTTPALNLTSQTNTTNAIIGAASSTTTFSTSWVITSATTNELEITTGKSAFTTTSEASTEYFNYTCRIEQSVANYTFPPTQPGIVSYSEETCPNNENVPLASIMCSLGEDSYDADTIRESKCEAIGTIVNQTYTNTTLETLEFATANVTALNEEVVGIVADFLKSISDDDEIVFTEKQIVEAAAVVSHLTEHYVETSDETTDRAAEKQDFVQSITKIPRKLVSDNTSTVSVLTPDINVEVRDIVEEENLSAPAEYTFNASFYENKSTDVLSNPMTISIPTTTLSQARSLMESPLRIVTVAFRSSVLFPSNRTTEWVIATTLGNSTHVLENIKLEAPVAIVFSYIKEEAGVKRPNSFTKIITELECVFWDFEIGDWSLRGCALLPGLPASCECDHLTNFAILVSRSELNVDVALSLVTYIGSGLSIAGLMLTFIIICHSRNNRRTYQMQIVANICISLAVALTMFVAGVDSQVNTIQCTIVTALLQYSFLVTWFWTGVYSYTIYRDIVQVMESLGRRFKMQFAALFAYGVPLIIVLLNAGITLGHIDRKDAGASTFESSYRAGNYCWLRYFSLYFGFLLPVGLLLLFNIVVFCIVIPKISCKMDQIKSTKRKRTLRQHIVTSVCLATTMGLSWIFGYVMLVSEDPTFLTAMSWLFALTNSFQGVFTFYITAIRTGKFQKVYAPVIRRFSTVSVVSTGLSSVDNRSETE